MCRIGRRLRSRYASICGAGAAYFDTWQWFNLSNTYLPVRSFSYVLLRLNHCHVSKYAAPAPQILAYLLRSLRPILHINYPNSMLSYSKGSRGLFVPSRVIGIFTDTTISLSSRLRQRPDHYTIRAGRNLPDKEFRYLRTVIVTAAVYWGFNSMLLLR